MKKICFVCHGNICRSPMAEAVFRSLLEARHLEPRFEVDSAAVSSEELGNGVYPAAQAEMLRRGLPKSAHRAWQLSRGDYDRFDFFVVMDMDNFYRLQRIFGGDGEHKIGLLMGYTEHPCEVEDPWYTGRFSHVFDQISEGCEALLEQLLADEKRS